MDSVIAFLLALVAIVVAISAHMRLSSLGLKEVLRGHARRLNELERNIRDLKEEVRALTAVAPKPEAPPVAARPAATPPQIVTKAAPFPTPEPIPAVPPPPKPEPPPRTAPAPQPVRVEPHPIPEPVLATPLPSLPPHRIAPAPPARQLLKLDWEGLVGVKLFSWIAGIAMLLAAVFFLRYSIDRGWLSAPVRVAIGALVGIGLLVLCERKAARKYPVTANAMDASAIAILFSTFFAAHALWNLIGATLCFGLLVLVTAVAVLLSIRRDSLFIALLGLLGGFAAPALLSTGENRPITLFSYLLLLNAGLAWVASKKKWPLLTGVSLALTTIYQWTWVAKFLTASQLPLASVIFLVFPILTFVMLSIGRRKGTDADSGIAFGRIAEMGAFLPLMYAFYLAAVRGYGSHYVILFGFLFLLDTGLFVIALTRKRDVLQLVGGGSTIMVFALWLANSYVGEAWPGILVFATLFVLLYLCTPFVAQRLRRGFPSVGINAVLAAPLLLFVFPALVQLEPRCASPQLPFGLLLILVAAISFVAIVISDGRVYYFGAFLALVAEAVWSARYLTQGRLFAGLALYLIFGLMYIAVPMIARRWGKPLQPEAAGAVLLLASLALLFFLTVGPGGGVALWGLALLLLIQNLGLFREGAVSKHPSAAIAGIALSWIILASFWANASLGAILIPALVVICGFAVLVLAGTIWMQKEAGDKDHRLGTGVFLGLAGHLFLFAVASQLALAVPPWPLLGALFLLDLAVGAAALYARRHDLLVGAVGASALILIVWVVVAADAPWPIVAVMAGGALALFSFVWVALVKRLRIESAPFIHTAAGALILAQIIAITSSSQPGTPDVGFLIAAHLVFLIALLGVAWARNLHVLAVIAVVPTAIAVTLWTSLHPHAAYWQSQLLFAGLIYLIFVFYPMLLGRRAGPSLNPHLAAVLASAVFFFQARFTILQAGYGSYIGILPVTQAIIMAGLLRQLLHSGSREARDLKRLALVAGTALAFVTVAIPLQLENEWITIGWAIEGAALAWLYRRIPHKGLLCTAVGLLTTVFVRLTLNPAVLNYAPRGGLRVWNRYLYAYMICAAALLLAGRLLVKTKDDLFQWLPRPSKLLPAGGAILLFLLLNIEIADYYSVGAAITFNFTATLAQDLTYTLGWALFAVVLLAAGIAVASHPARIAALALLIVTILKCFLHDLARLGGLYRVMSFVGLALCLALVAVVLQKYVLAERRGAR